jgi:hypothetical protein
MEKVQELQKLFDMVDCSKSWYASNPSTRARRTAAMKQRYVVFWNSDLTQKTSQTPRWNQRREEATLSLILATRPVPA